MKICRGRAGDMSATPQILAASRRTDSMPNYHVKMVYCYAVAAMGAAKTRTWFYSKYCTRRSRE